MAVDGLPKYQLWQPQSLDAGALAQQQVKLPTAEALESLHQQAHEEGYNIGFSEGVAAGRQQGRVQAEEEVARLRALVASVEEAVEQLEQATGENLLGLALKISEQIMRQALKARPELLLPIVQGVMDGMPQHAQHPHLHLHPEDAALVRTHMTVELSQGGWRVIEDQRIARGGCRIETAVSELDATLATRWQRLAAALGHDMRWLDE